METSALDDCGQADCPFRLVPGGMPTEARPEELIEAEPTILGEPLLIIGRQVPTSFGKIIDLLAVDADGILHVLEPKKDKTPREVVAQVLDYGSWVRSLTHADVLKLFADYGMFANQSSATKLCNRFALDQLTAESDRDDDSATELDEIAARQ